MRHDSATLPCCTPLQCVHHGGFTDFAHAWGNDGHQTVGAIADQLLTANAKSEVTKRLLNGETLSTVSIWADCAKGYCGPLTPEMHAFVDANPRHHNYHFTDIPFQETQYAPDAIGSDPDDVVHILQQVIAVLQSHTQPGDNPHWFSEREALLLLVHLVGDVHQPLHVGSAYMSQEDDYTVPHSPSEVTSGVAVATDGANCLKIGTRALHAYWDTNAVKYAMRRAGVSSPTDYAGYLLHKDPKVVHQSGAMATWPTRWAEETLKLSHEAYRNVVPGEREEEQGHNKHCHWRWAVTLPHDYARTASKDAERALIAAGKRLASVLNTIWP